MGLDFGSILGNDYPYEASGELVRYRAVKRLSNTEVEQCDTAGERAAGIVQVGSTTEDSDRGKQVAVRVFGASFAEAGAAVARDAFVTTDNQGRLVAATTGQVPIGIALSDDATAAGHWFGVLIVPGLAAVS